MEAEKKHSLVRTIYMYLVCLVAVVTFIVGAISTLNITLKYFVFDLKTVSYGESPAMACNQPYNYPGKEVDMTTNTFKVAPTAEETAACIDRVTKDQEDQGRRQALENLSWALAALIVSLPVWMYHWRFIKKQ